MTRPGYLTGGRIPDDASSARYGAVLRGNAPAEALSPEHRQRLVRFLVGLGRTDREIAELTRMTTYTTARIRERLGVRANAGKDQAA